MLERLAPFGMGNPEPNFVLRGARVISKRILKELHVKLVLDAGGKRIEAIGFNMADRPVPDVTDIAVSLQINEWNGRRNLQLRIKDLRPAIPGEDGGVDGA
jgi:single-stranded-DNA-specific exonuclease